MKTDMKKELPNAVYVSVLF